MLTLQKLAISLWLLIFLTSFAVSVPMSHVLRVQNEGFNLREESNRDKRETVTELPKVSILII